MDTRRDADSGSAPASSSDRSLQRRRFGISPNVVRSGTDTASHRGCSDDHRDHQRRFDVADRADATRRTLVGYPGFPVSARVTPPSNQSDHRPDLENQNQREKTHLHQEDVVLHVVGRGFFDAREQTPQPGSDPQSGRDAPPGISDERPANGNDIEWTHAQHSGASPDRSQSYSEGEE